MTIAHAPARPAGSPAAAPAPTGPAPSYPTAPSCPTAPSAAGSGLAGLLLDREEWTSQAACRSGDPDELFVSGAAQNRAKTVCLGCPVRTECLADALDNRVEFGVWGGMTERERRALLRRRPDVTSWRELLETARTEHERRADRAS